MRPAESSIAVVTGAGSGIGKACAIAFAKRGLDVVAIGRQQLRLDATAEEVRALGRRAHAIACDVTSDTDVAHAAERVLSHAGTPHIIVNNAGVVRRDGNIEDTSSESFDSVIQTNLRGPFLVCRAFLGAMKKVGHGRLIFVGSISSTLGCPGFASYAASKWGLLGLMKSLAEELRGTGLITSAVLPGSVDTDMLKGSGFAPHMTADDVANAIVYLSLDAPTATHGSALEMFG